MKKMLVEYFGDWWKVMARPIYFYTFMEKGAWSDKSFTFLMTSSLLLSLALSIAGFILQILPILISIVEGITGLKFLLIIPVLLVLCLAFFLIIFLMVTGGLIVFSMIAFACAAIATSFIARYILNATGDIKEAIKSFFYSSAVYIPMILLAVLAISVRFRLIPYNMFIIGENVVVYCVVIYMWGLWSISIRKVFKLSKMKSAGVSLIPILIVVLLQLGASLKVLPSLERWIS